MYEQYLRALLAPLGVYDLTDGSVSGAELYALGGALDAAGGRLDSVERESLTATAEGEGLLRRETLFARRPAAVTAEERRAAIAALLQIDGDSLTPAAIDRHHPGLRHPGPGAGDGRRKAAGGLPGGGGHPGGI